MTHEIMAKYNNYDLFSRRSGYISESMMIITPYVERSFFEYIARELNPERLCVVIDDGCRDEDIDTVKEAIQSVPNGQRPKLTLVLGSAPGLVHLKLFYIVWRSDAGRTSRTLVFGSANATRQGFSGAINAELIASCKLTKSAHGHVIHWCESVIKAASSSHESTVYADRDLIIGRNILLRLPKISIGRQRNAISNFDLWIQRGFLLSDYRPEQGFLNIPIPLKNSLGQSEQSRIATMSGFSVPKQKRLNYPYVDGTSLDDFDDDQEESSNWRRRLFTWTQLGEWCSEACYVAKQGEFRRRGHEERARKIEQLDKLQAHDKKESSQKKFIENIENLWNRLGSQANLFLEGNNSLDYDFYSNMYTEKIDRDVQIAGNAEFRRRYIDGYELTSVPRFRSDVKGWNEFLDSFVRQLCSDNERQRIQSRLFRAVHAAISQDGARLKTLRQPDLLLKFLRKICDSNYDHNISNLIMNYHLID